MSENKKNHGYMVATSNEFMQQARLNLTNEMQKFLCYVISKIKPSDEKFQEYEISALEFGELAGIDQRHVYDEFKKMIEMFDGQARWIKIGDDTIYFRVFSEAEYNDKRGSVTVMLNKRLKAHLLKLGTSYTMFELWNVLSLHRKYSIRLYEIFRSYSYKHMIDFEIDELKSLLCCENYVLYAEFKRRVLEPAVKEINELTDLIVRYGEKKRGKGGKITKLYFEIERKKSLEAYSAYIKTIDKINKRDGQIPGQMSIFDLGVEDFLE